MPYPQVDKLPPTPTSAIPSVLFDFLFKLETLGSPKSSPSSLSYANSSSSSLVFQSLFVCDRKSVYVLREGEASPELVLVSGGVLLLAIPFSNIDDGGVLGRAFPDDSDLV